MTATNSFAIYFNSQLHLIASSCSVDLVEKFDFIELDESAN